ncbi:MAG: glycosyltransferase family 4 protein [Magnetococcales bacterium]|nr:glycosyltransferase family 4 protein [Magnetococcales bacterium]
MKILTFTTLYPHPGHPTLGVFVEERLRHLHASNQVDLKIVAPLPWFFLTHPRLNPYAWQGRHCPKKESRHGLEINHPRYFLIPKVSMNLAPFTLALSTLPLLRRMIAEGYDFDLIDAHYFYPDGVAAALLGKMLNKPVVITARGSDINQIPRSFLPRQMIRQAAKEAKAMITVCGALKKSLVEEIGVEPEKVTVLRNGVDLKKFHPQERSSLRKRLGINGPTLLSVGYLIERKGHDLVIAALTSLPGMALLIAGDGPLREQLQSQAQRLGVADRVRFVGQLPQAELIDYYAAADLLVLASSREGWANVLLESMACGTPVVASRVWGTPEAVCSEAAGVLMDERSAEGVAQGVKAVLASNPDREATRRYAEQFSWDNTTQGQLDLFHTIIDPTA